MGTLYGVLMVNGQLPRSVNNQRGYVRTASVRSAWWIIRWVKLLMVTGAHLRESSIPAVPQTPTVRMVNAVLENAITVSAYS